MSDEWDYDDLHDEYRPDSPFSQVDREVKHYQHLVPRTLLDRPEAPVADEDLMNIWNVMGLAGEAGEIAELVMDSPHLKDRIADELGDTIWYVAALCEKLSFSFPKIVQLADREPFLYLTVEPLALRLCAHAGKLVELFKKGVFHRHGLDRDALELELINCMTFILGIAAEYQLRLTGLLKDNIKKLEVRYKDGFTSDQSINRS